MLYLHDGLNVIRRRLETATPRTLVTEMLNAPAGDIHVWAFEGAGHLKARRDLFPSYKYRPSTAPDGFFALVGLIRDALKHTHALQVDVPGFEADDVIAQLACTYAGQMPIRIMTTDRDLNQLLVLPGVTSTAKALENVEPRFVRLYKTFVGDASDKIPGVRGFGDITWAGVDKSKLSCARTARTFAAYIDAGLSPRLAEACIRQADQIDVFHRIIGFFEISDIKDHIKPGYVNPERADAILREFHH